MIRAEKNVSPSQYKKFKQQNARPDTLKERFDLKYRRIRELEELGKTKELKIKIKKEMGLLRSEKGSAPIKKTAKLNEVSMLSKKTAQKNHEEYPEDQKKDWKEEQSSFELDEKIWPFEDFSQEDLEKQYKTLKKAFVNAQILEKLLDDRLGVRGINEQEYAFPKLEDIIKKMKENKKILQLKIRQGFQQLLIVPFGMNLNDLTEKYKKVITKYNNKEKIFATKRNQFNSDRLLKLKKINPVWVYEEYKNADTNNDLIYYPKEFSKNHQGKTKKEILEQTRQAFEIALIEDLTIIPKKDEGKEFYKRKQLETNKTPNEYLTIIQTDPAYSYEQGMTPESYMAYAIYNLEKNNQVIDNPCCADSIFYQLGAFFLASGHIARTRWFLEDRLIGYQIILGVDSPESCFSFAGARTMVNILKN